MVNDGSTDETWRYLDQVADFYPQLRVVHQLNGGPAKARNAALRQARGEIIAFTDDDCVADRDWLESILSSWEDDILGLQGATYTDREHVTPLTHQIDNETGHDSIPTCNAAYSRQILLDIRGFDESFPSPHNEDADVSWRVQQLGKVRFCPQMRVYHPPRKDAFRKVACRMKILESEFTLFRKNPGLYQEHRDRSALAHIYGRVFFLNIGYHFLSRIKLWRRPKLMIQGILLTLCWWIDLLGKFPRFAQLARVSTPAPTLR